MKKIVVTILSFIVCTAGISQSISVQDYINTYKDLAISEMKRTGIPASITIAQGILETENGNSDLVRRSNNHFGIKCKNTWKGPSVSHDDDAPGECFRKYESAEDSYRDHSNFLKGSSRYAFLFELDPLDYKSWAHGLKKAGYATNPRYPAILIKNIETYNLQQFDRLDAGEPESRNEDIAVAVKTDKEISQQSIGANIKTQPVVVENNSKSAEAEIKSLSAAEDSKLQHTVVDNKPPSKVVAQRVTKSFTNPAGNTESIKSGKALFNGLKAVFVPAGTSLLAIATEFDMALAKLMEYNDMQVDGILEHDQWIFLEKKKKSGNRDFHVTEQGETLYSISQVNAIQLQYLVQYNNLSEKAVLKKGTKVLLRPRNENAVKPVTGKIIIHEVQPKEGLYAISKMYNVSVQEIKEMNSLSSDELSIGQQLKISK